MKLPVRRHQRGPTTKTEPLTVFVQLYGYWTNPQRGPQEFLGARSIQGHPGDVLEIPVQADRIVRRIILSVANPKAT